MIARITHGFDRARRAFLDLLLPPRCVVCRRPGDWFCAACRSRVTPLAPPWCQRCGQPLEDSECPACCRHPLRIDGLRAVALFRDEVRTAIHAYKYKHCTELAPIFAAMLDDYLSAYPLPTPDVLIPVPLHPERERQRGYNQARLIAQELALYRNLPMWYNGLERVWATTPQVGLDARARHDNMRGAFAASAKVAGQRVLLIDDVCTTGATMDACSIALKERGAKSVWGLTLARGR